MSKQSLRDKMPVIAAIVTDLREIFGQPLIDQQMRRAMRGEPTFWAQEAGIEFGTRGDKVEVPIVDGRGIFFSVDMPNGVALDEWLGKVNKAMDQVKARLKAAAKQQDSAAQAGRPNGCKGGVNA